MQILKPKLLWEVAAVIESLKLKIKSGIPNVDGLSSKNGHEKQEVPHVRPVLNCSLEQSPHFPQCPAAGPSRGPSRGRGVGS